MHHYLRHLANFARIVEAGSMRAASDLIGVAPSGLSDSVRILETRIGSPLLIRHKDGVTPTSEGERVYASASGIVDLLDNVMGGSESKPLSGPCRLSVPTEVSNTCLGPVLSHLMTNEPGLEISVFSEDEMVDYGRFGRDYFLRISSKTETYDGLREVWSGRAKAILVASRQLVSGNDVDDVETLCRLNVVLSPTSKPPHEFNLRNPNAKVTFQRPLYSSHPSARLAMAKQGLGVTGCLDFCAADDINAGSLVRLLPDRFEIPLTVKLFTPHQRPRRLDPPVVAAFQNLLD